METVRGLNPHRQSRVSLSEAPLPLQRIHQVETRLEIWIHRRSRRRPFVSTNEVEVHIDDPSLRPHHTAPSEHEYRCVLDGITIQPTDDGHSMLSGRDGHHRAIWSDGRAHTQSMRSEVLARHTSCFVARG